MIFSRKKEIDRLEKRIENLASRIEHGKYTNFRIEVVDNGYVVKYDRWSPVFFEYQSGHYMTFTNIKDAESFIESKKNENL